MKVRFFIHIKRKEYAKRVKKELRRLMKGKVTVFLDRDSVHQMAETDKCTYEKAFGVTIELRAATNKEARGVEYWQETSYRELPYALREMIEFVEIDKPLAVKP